MLFSVLDGIFITRFTWEQDLTSTSAEFWEILSAVKCLSDHQLFTCRCTRCTCNNVNKQICRLKTALILVFEATKIDKTVPNLIFWMPLVKRTNLIVSFSRQRQTKSDDSWWLTLALTFRQKFDWLIWSCDIAPCDLNYEWITEKYRSTMKLTILLRIYFASFLIKYKLPPKIHSQEPKSTH